MRDRRGSSLLRRTTIGVVAGALLLSGCSEKQEANDTLPSTSASPSTEALPEVGPADFPVPDEARTKDAAGAEAFGLYFIELINHQQVALEGQPLRDLGPDCQDCLRIAQTLDETAEAGQRIEGGELSMVSEPQVILRDDEAAFTFIARIEAVAVYDASGNLVPDSQYSADERLSSGFDLTWSAEDVTWHVNGAFFG